MFERSQEAGNPSVSKCWWQIRLHKTKTVAMDEISIWFEIILWNFLVVIKYWYYVNVLIWPADLFFKAQARGTKTPIFPVWYTYSSKRHKYYIDPCVFRRNVFVPNLPILSDTWHNYWYLTPCTLITGILFVSLLSHFWLIYLSTISSPLSSSLCSITPETSNVDSSYNRMWGPGIGCWFSDRSTAATGV